MSCEPGEVVEVPFPFIDRPLCKRRPALVLAAPRSGTDAGTAILAMITSAKRSRWESDIALANLETAGLRAPSVVRWKVFSIEQSLIVARRGRLSAADRRRPVAGFQEVFAGFGSLARSVTAVE